MGPIPVRGQNSATFSRLGSLKLAFLGPLDPKIGQITWVLTSSEVKIRSPNGEICLGTTDFGLQRQKSGSWVSDLGSQTLELASQRADLASQRSKMTSERPKIGLPDLKN